MRRLIAATTLWFQFHSSFWPNLHHFLYQQALLRHRSATPATLAVLADTAPLTPAERATWARVLTYYDSAVSIRAIDHDSTLVDVNYALADADSAALIPHAGLPAPLVAALQSAAPIYRRYFWPRHDSANRAWIAAMQQELSAHGVALTAALSRVYHVPLPKTPIRVEVVAYANWAGAYTTDDPVLITMSSTYANHRGSLGLEQIVHETSHAMMDSVDAVLHSVADSRDVEHAIIFFTAGELVRREIPSHTPFAEVRGLWTPGGSPLARYYATVVPIWREYLDGRTSFREALTRITSLGS
jgi:hypothetical protein